MAKKIKIPGNAGLYSTINGQNSGSSSDTYTKKEIDQKIANATNKQAIYSMLKTILAQGNYVQLTKNDQLQTITIAYSEKPIPEEPNTGIYSFLTEYEGEECWEWIQYDISSLCNAMGDMQKITATGLTTGKTYPFVKSKFNQPIKIAADVPEKNNFLQDCILFDQPVDLSKVTWKNIGTNFMQGCSTFKSKLIFNGLINYVGDSFMVGCTSFNTEIEGLFTEHLWKIGDFFMNNNIDFSQDIPLVNCTTLQAVGKNFMYNTKKFAANLYLTETQLQMFDSAPGTKTFTTNSTEDLVYKNGFHVVGVTEAVMQEKFPDITSGEGPFRFTVCSLE